MNDINWFMPGQVWSYQTRNGEELSTLAVLQVDQLDGNSIVHVRIENICMEEYDHIPHLPFSHTVIEAYVTEFIRHLDFKPDFDAGYQHWKAQFDEDMGGSWRIPVKDTLDAIHSNIRERRQSG